MQISPPILYNHGRVVRALLIDDHPFVRDGLAGFLRAQPDFEIVGEASSGAEGVEKMRNLLPDLVIVDLRLPDMDGNQVLAAVREMRWRTYAVVLSAFRSDDDLLMASRSGARGYLLKTDSGTKVLETIRRVMAGDDMLDPQIGPALRQRLLQKDLTNKETLILRCVGRGMTNKEICRAMNLSENTVKTHLRGVFFKLGVSNRAEASAIASQRGLVG
ncbi:MAG TPA: response regulator transcription factor [Chthoniobacterales bacterium]|nr:response regulator transcription factor [Chthoniobacterales bacterium]